MLFETGYTQIPAQTVNYIVRRYGISCRLQSWIETRLYMTLLLLMLQST
jgi:hypothetical protein